MSYDENFRPKAIPKRVPQRELDKQSEKSNSCNDDQVLTDELLSGDSQKEGARVGDNMIDRPKGMPQPMQGKISDNFKPASASVKGTEKVNIDDLLHHADVNSHGLFRSSFWVLGLTLILALLTLYVSAQSISILHDALILPDPGRWIAVGFLCVLVGIILYVIIQAVLFIARLSSGSQLSIEQLVSLSNFPGIRTYRVACEEFLKPYLEGLIGRPQKTQAKFLQMVGADKIIESAQALLDADRRLGSREWVNEFVENIQLPMEALAVERINVYARAAALKTAISPWPLVDMASVVYNSTRMLTDLAIIFNRRFSRGNTIRILTGMFFTVFIAGHTQDAVDAIDGELGHQFASGVVDPGAVNMEDHVNSFAESAFEHVGHGALIFAKFSTKKFAEGAASWLLMKRLGRRAIKMLKPIAGDVK